MRYAGSISIIDDQGVAVFERELTSDEMIAELIRETRRGDAPDGIVVPEVVVEEACKTIGMVLGGKKLGRPRKGVEVLAKHEDHKARKQGEAKECCGSKGARHFKWCKEMGGTGDPTLVAVAGGRIPFSEKTYNAVRAMYADGMGTDMIVAEKGFDVEECRKIKMSSTYDAYRRAK